MTVARAGWLRYFSVELVHEPYTMSVRDHTRTRPRGRPSQHRAGLPPGAAHRREATVVFACSPPPGSPGPPGGPNDNGAGWSTANPSGGARYRRRQTLAPRCVAVVCALTAPPHGAVHERQGAGRRGQLFIDS